MGKTENDVEERGRPIRVVAEVGADTLQREGGDLAKAAWRLGGGLPAPHIDPERVANLFGDHHNLE